MANFSAAFGYDLYIVPMASSSVDVAFTGITEADASSGGFINSANATTGSVAYASGVFTIDGVTYAMDGTDAPIRLSGITNAALETDTGTEEVYTYDDETKGFSQVVATTKGFSLSLSGVADFKDTGYQVLRLTEANTVADSLRVKFVRVGPTGTVESVYGYGTLTGYTESNEVSSIVSWECTLTGYGAYKLDLDPIAQITGGIATTDTLATQTSSTSTSGSGVAVTFGSGDGAGTVDTDGSGDITAVNITTAGTTYSVGDTVEVTEDSGAGIATFRVASIS